MVELDERESDGVVDEGRFKQPADTGLAVVEEVVTLAAGDVA